MDYVGPAIEHMKGNYAFANKIILGWPKSGDKWDSKFTFYYDGTGVIPKSDSFVRFLKALGTTHGQLKASETDMRIGEVETAWFYFNWHREADTMARSSTKDIDIKKIVDKELKVGDMAYVKVIYGGNTGMIIDGHKEEWGIDSDGTISESKINMPKIMEKIFNNPFVYIANIVSSKFNRDTVDFTQIDTGITPLKSYAVPKGVRGQVFDSAVQTNVLRSKSKGLDKNSNAKYFSLALLDSSESVFTPTRNKDGSIKIASSGYMNSSPLSYSKPATYQKEDVDPLLHPKYAKKYPQFLKKGSLVMEDYHHVDGFNKAGVSSGYYEVYEYTYNGGSKNSTLYDKIKEYLPKILVRDGTANFVKNTMQKQVMNDIYEKSDSYISAEQMNFGNDKWKKFYKDGHISTELVLKTPRYEFVEFVAECIDTDFDAQDPSSLEIIVAVFTVIIAVIVVVASAGTAAPGIVGGLTALATGLGYASLVLTIGGLMLSQMGNSAAGLVRVIGKVAQIVGYAAMVTGIFAAVGSAFNSMAKEAVKQGTIASTSDYTISMFAQEVFSNVIDKLTSGFLSMFDTVLDIATGNISGIIGQTAGASTSLMGWMTRLQDAFSVYNKFFASNGDTQPINQSEEQANKRSYQFPEQLYQFQEQIVYEKDALQKMSMLKDQQLGGHKTEQIISGMA